MTAEPRSHKLWGGRFSVPTAAALEATADDEEASGDFRRFTESALRDGNLTLDSTGTKSPSNKW